MAIEATRRFWPWVLVSTVRPTTTRRSLSGTWSAPSPMKSTQCAAVSTWNGVIRLPPQYCRWKSSSPKDWASSAAWNRYSPSATGPPPTIRGLTGAGWRTASPGPVLIGSRSAPAAVAVDAPARVIAPARHAVRTANRTRRCMPASRQRGCGGHSLAQPASARGRLPHLEPRPVVRASGRRAVRSGHPLWTQRRPVRPSVRAERLSATCSPACRTSSSGRSGSSTLQTPKKVPRNCSCPYGRGKNQTCRCAVPSPQ